MQSTIVERRLGVAAMRMHGAVLEVERIAADHDAHAADRALVAITLAILCGEYHDYRSGRVLPKGDLVTALRAVPSHPEVDDAIAGLITRIVTGEFDEDAAEAARFAARHAGTKQAGGRPDPEPIATIHLTDRERRAHTWLYRYCEVYSRGPSYPEMMDGLGATSAQVAELLRMLAKKGAATTVGGTRGWLPTRAP